MVDFRRAIDLLLSRDLLLSGGVLSRGGVDAARIAYVGHSFDASVRAILAGVEKRISTFVLMAGSCGDEYYVFQSGAPETYAEHCESVFGEPKLMKYYDASHALNARARQDRVLWLVKRLRLKPIDEAELKKIPQLQ